jgi:hypothetical protein
MGSKYIEAKTFSDFKENQDQLIKVLNHNMTKMSVDISWMKKLIGWQLGIIAALTITIIIKSVIGG